MDIKTLLYNALDDANMQTAFKITNLIDWVRITLLTYIIQSKKRSIVMLNTYNKFKT